MNRDRLEGHWKQTKGRARKSAGRWNASGPEAGPAGRPAATPASRDWVVADITPPRPLRDAPER